MAIFSNLTKRCVLCKFRLRIGRIVNEKLKIGVWIIFFCLKIQNIKFKILNGRTVHGPLSDILRNIFNGLLALTKLPSLKRCNILLNWLEISSPFGIEIMLNAFSVFAENENLMIGRLPRNSSSTTRPFILL